jgi:hypothetical protein
MAPAPIITTLTPVSQNNFIDFGLELLRHIGSIAADLAQDNPALITANH